MEELIVFRVQQTLFENDYTEFSKQLRAVKLSKIIYIFLSAMMIMLALIMCLAKEYVPAVFYFAFAIAIIFAMIRFPNIMGKQLFKNYSKLHNSYPIYSDIVFCDSHIYDNTKNASTTFEYSQIEKIMETPTHFFLMITDSAGIIIKKDSFVQGDISQFRGFIASKTIIK